MSELAPKKSGKKAMPEGRRIQPGQVLNPTGRPKIPDELKAELKRLVPGVVAFWAKLVDDPRADNKDRLRASENIFDRAYGRAAQAISFEDEEGNPALPNITVTFVKPEDTRKFDPREGDDPTIDHAQIEAPRA